MTERAYQAVHVVGYIHDEASGPSYSVVRLAEAQASRGWSVELCCAQSARSIESVKVSVYRELRRNDGWAISPGMIPAITDRSGKVAVIHNHGLWAFPNI